MLKIAEVESLPSLFSFDSAVC